MESGNRIHDSWAGREYWAIKKEKEKEQKKNYGCVFLKILGVREGEKERKPKLKQCKLGERRIDLDRKRKGRGG